MKERQSDRSWLAAVAILDYLAQNPKAADTEAGIHQWWLPSVIEQVSESDVRSAIEMLAQRNLVERSGTVNRLNPRKLAEVRRIAAAPWKLGERQ